MELRNLKLSGKTRKEKDLLGEREIPIEHYFGIQTQRALENFSISRTKLYHYPQFVVALADVKEGATLANRDLKLMDEDIANAIIEACQEIKEGKLHQYFVVDMIQGGAGTSTNMNINEVVANRALEILGYEKGDYIHCHPNNHVNLSQSTNDAYPSAMKIALYRHIGDLMKSLEKLVEAFREKGKEFSQVIKMGRTQLQDAVPMTLGQEFEAFAYTLNEEVQRIKQNRDLFLEINMGATAIGTGINSDPDYTPLVTRHLAQITQIPLREAPNMIEATSDTGVFVMNSSTVKRLAIKLSKISNDLRLLSSGPRTGLNEINLPPMQPGSSIMPGKVNPVIPEVVNQIAYRVVGNDLTITMASEAGQLQLNVMEPIIAFSLLESIDILINGMDTLREKCIVGITANEEHCKEMVMNSIGLVTALNPYLGYENSSKIAKEAMLTGKKIYNIILDQGLMDKDLLDEVLKPENMIKPRKINLN